MMKTLLLTTVLSIGFFVAGYAQPSAEEEVKVAINRFFESFPKRDGKLMSSFFAPQVSMATVFRNKEDSLVLRYGQLEDFINAIGADDGHSWEEKVFNIKVNVTDGLAQVWCDYAFHYDGKLHHCGVNALHLVKLGDEWKITQITDTRSPCKEESE